MILSAEISLEMLVSLSCDWLSLELKSPRTTNKNGFFFETKSRVISKLSENVAKLSFLWMTRRSVKCNETTKFVDYYQIKSNAFF